MKLSRSSSGNALFLILVAIALFAALTAAITSGNKGSGSLTGEKLNLAANQVGAFGVDLKRAAENVLRGGNSETTLSFAQLNLPAYGTPGTSPKTEVFNIEGGGVGYLDVPENINDGSKWEFTANTAIPGVGDNAVADLVMVLPNVTQDFCRAYNQKAGYELNQAIPTDTSACIFDTSKRFTGTYPTSGINTMDAGTFRTTPAPFACVACGAAYHAYYTLIER